MSCRPVTVKMVVRCVYVHCAIWITILCVRSSTTQIITSFRSNTTTTHRYWYSLCEHLQVSSTLPKENYAKIHGIHRILELAVACLIFMEVLWSQHLAWMGSSDNLMYLNLYIVVYLDDLCTNVGGLSQSRSFCWTCTELNATSNFDIQFSSSSLLVSMVGLDRPFSSFRCAITSCNFCFAISTAASERPTLVEGMSARHLLAFPLCQQNSWITWFLISFINVRSVGEIADIGCSLVLTSVKG
jgi:hypothetical protein